MRRGTQEEGATRRGSEKRTRRLWVTALKLTRFIVQRELIKPIIRKLLKHRVYDDYTYISIRMYMYKPSTNLLYSALTLTREL